MLLVNTFLQEMFIIRRTSGKDMHLKLGPIVEAEYVLCEVDDGLRAHTRRYVPYFDAKALLFRLLSVLLKYERTEVVGLLPPPAVGQHDLGLRMRFGDLELQEGRYGVGLRHVREDSRGLSKTVSLEHGRVHLPRDEGDQRLHVLVIPPAILTPYRQIRPEVDGVA